MPSSSFELGECYITPGASHIFGGLGISPQILLAQHRSGDWRVIDNEDRRANERALRDGSRLLSA